MWKPAIRRTIHNTDELRSYMNRPGRSGITLRLEGVTADEAGRLERKIDGLQSVCGCRAGLIAGAAGLALWMGTFASRVGPESALGWRVAFAVAAFALPAALAKVAALQFARHRMRTLVADLVRRAGAA